jgi:hypothetical protein
MAEESVGYIQAVAEDLKRVRGSLDRLESRLEELQKSFYSNQTGKMQLIEIDQVRLAASIKANEDDMRKLRDWQTWLVRLVIGSFLTGILGIILALVAKGF